MAMCRIFSLLVLVCLSFANANNANDEELNRLVDYWHSFEREDDSNLLTNEILPHTQLWLPQIPKHSWAYKWSLQNKAKPDECFFGADQPSTSGPCPTGSTGTNKTNQGYAWSAVKYGQNVFWGTVSNYLCLGALPLLTALGQLGPLVTPDVVCLNSLQPNGIPKDYRPPQIFLRNAAAGVGIETRISDQILVNFQAATLLNTTLGIRAAGVSNGVAIFGGPSLSGASLNLFAFSAATGAFVGATTLPAFNDIRKFADIDGQTYLAVFGASGFGYLLRYKGGLPPTNNPLALTVVAKLVGNPAEAVAFDSQRLLVSTWAMPTLPTGFGSGRLILTPSMSTLPDLAPANNVAAIAALGFTPGFNVVWNVLSYEPDPVTAFTLGASDVAKASDGWFYWGTFQFPPQPLGYFQLAYNLTADPLTILKVALGSRRPTSVFRGRNFDTTPEVELLYGERYFPVYEGASGKWTAKPNLLGVTPKYGRSGFGNRNNVYLWTAEDYKGDVLLGTFDESYVIATFLKNLIPTEDTYNLGAIFGFQPPILGADLYVFQSRLNHLNPYNPAQWITLSGLDNKVNYGIRNIVHDAQSPDEDRWVTTANPFNVNPAGGWEIYRLAKIF